MGYSIQELLKKLPFEKKAPMGSKAFFFFFFLNFCSILYQDAYNFAYKTAKFYVLNLSRSIILIPPKYTLEN